MNNIADSTDLDVYAWDGSFIPSINDNSEADGSYLLGAFPPGTFYVRADPEPLSFYVLRYFDDKVSLETADPIVIAGEETVSGIDLRLPGGGVIGGTIRDMAGIPLAGIDIDIFDSSGMQITDLDDDTDAAGHYEIGAMEPGLYYVLADPDPALGYIDTFFGGSFQIETATPVGVSAGVYASGIDIYLPTGGTISGRVTSAVGGSPVDGTRIHAFDSSGHSLSGQSVSTAADRVTVNSATTVPVFPSVTVTSLIESEGASSGSQFPSLRSTETLLELALAQTTSVRPSALN